MVFLSQTAVEKRIDEIFQKGTYNPKGFSRQSSYDLRLGEEVLVTPMKEPIYLKESQVVNIEPGQFAALTTEEYITIPKDLLGFITIRFKYKSKGLVNISGFHVDPLFKGKLIFSVYNVGPTVVTLRRGEKVFSIFFSKIEPSVDPDKPESKEYDEIHKIPLDIVQALAGMNVPSLQKLDGEIKQTRTIIEIYGVIITGIIITLLVALLIK